MILLKNLTENNRKNYIGKSPFLLSPHPKKVDRIPLRNHQSFWAFTEFLISVNE